ncbi:MAG: hypothetical protein IPK02_00200 [Candidatus Accumulibacter sp.]|uniref:Sulfatase-modifying factor enzyme-like domain-containing protein n=1 Tax=Candidatus Accumulibacter affinis TaxID=2954384 RepID=A0A935W1Z3_9PROT|nr:hypothetical protein [Candidatus Accumulibacter affinis]
MSRVLRGGAWNNNPMICRAANRNDNARDNRENNIGFRVCRGARTVIIPARRQGAFWRLPELPADHGLPGRGRGMIDGAGLSRPHELCASGA